jgi:glycosyltransferase involved in cell wall biosynthesis
LTEQNEYHIIKADEIPCQEINDPAVLSKNPLVSAKMLTYNHEPYIAQAIEGVVKQETEYPFELIIGEDCSTDGTMEIVLEYQKKYPNIIRVITSDKNVGMKKNSARVTKACRGKYIAFCEGDDYWTDIYKIQKQLDLLENSQDCVMVHGGGGELIQNSGKFYSSARVGGKQIPSGCIYEQLLVNNFILTLTIVVRKSTYLNTIRKLDLFNKTWRMADYPTSLDIAKHHKIHYINEPLGVYRRLPDSASNSTDIHRRFLFEKNSFEIRFYFIEKYGATPRTIATIKKKYNEIISKYAFYLNDRSKMEAYGLFKDVESNLKTRCYNLGLKYRPVRLVLKTYLNLTKKGERYRPV